MGIASENQEESEAAGGAPFTARARAAVIVAWRRTELDGSFELPSGRFVVVKKLGFSAIGAAHARHGWNARVAAFDFARIGM